MLPKCTCTKQIMAIQISTSTSIYADFWNALQNEECWLKERWRKKGCIEAETHVAQLQKFFVGIQTSSSKHRNFVRQKQKPCKIQCKVVIFESTPKYTIVESPWRLKAVIFCFFYFLTIAPSSQLRAPSLPRPPGSRLLFILHWLAKSHDNRHNHHRWITIEIWKLLRQETL